MQFSIDSEEAHGNKVPSRLNHLRPQSDGVLPRQCDDRGGDLAHAQLAVSDPGQGGHHGGGPDRTPQPASLAQQDDCGLGGARDEVALLGDVGGQHRTKVGDGVVVETGEPLPDLQHLGDMMPQDPLTGGGHLLQETPGITGP